MGFRTPVDISNKALQTLRRPAIYSFNDNSVESVECARCYDELRLAELRRNLWRFSTRRIILRALTGTSQILVPTAWASGTSYEAGDVVAYNNQNWVALVDSLAKTPGDVPASGNINWESYYGALSLDVWNSPIEPTDSQAVGSLQPTSYFVGELVYVVSGGVATIYRSLINSNNNDPTGVDLWISDRLYSTGQVVSYQGTHYQSVNDFNFNSRPSTSANWTSTITSPLISVSWRVVAGSLSNIDISYPLGAGPAGDSRTRNAYRLPAGFLRQAPSDPKADINPYLGAPTGNMTVDWLFESNYIVSRVANPIMLRFQADVQSVPEMDSMFAVGLAQRMALELAPRLADAEHLASITADAREDYARTITEARTVNGIETGSVDPFEDDFITCRL